MASQHTEQGRQDAFYRRTKRGWPVPNVSNAFLSAAAIETLHDRQKHDFLRFHPACIKDVVPPKEYDRRLYVICRTLQNNTMPFQNLRTKTREHWLKIDPRSPTPSILTILFDGVYVGDPEDVVLQRLQGHCESPQYPIDGLGKKIASIEFADLN